MKNRKEVQILYFLGKSKETYLGMHMQSITMINSFNLLANNTMELQTKFVFGDQMPDWALDLWHQESESMINMIAEHYQVIPNMTALVSERNPVVAQKK